MKPTHKFATDARLSQAAFQKLFLMDRANVGTPDYAGLAYFWHYDLRHSGLRDCSCFRRVLVHDAFLRHGLALDGQTAQHKAIIKRYLK